MNIPYINTIDDIKQILSGYSIVYKQLSDEMYLIGLSDEFIIGSVSISLNEIRCRFHYTYGRQKYTNTFTYDRQLFIEELEKAKHAWLINKNIEIEKILDVL